MIDIRAARSRLSPLEQFGLMVLVDLSGLLPVEGSPAPVVRLELAESGEAQDWAPPVLAGSDGAVTVERATLRKAGALAGAVAEQESTARDRHGRVPSSENPLVRAGQERSPWVSRAARSLREAVLSHAGGRPVRTIAPWPGGRRWAAAFTHDLDVARLWPLFTGQRLFELGRKRQLARIARVLRTLPGSFIGNPVRAGVEEILAIEAEHGVASTWFVIAGVPSIRSTLQGDVTYSVETPETRRLLASVAAAGHEIGLHGSFATWQDGAVMAGETDRLRAAAGVPVTGIRQHFLRMRPGITQRAMQQAGFSYDATYGFPDRNGFRLGAADIVPAWDQQETRVPGLDEVPLTWMDRALSKYGGIEDPARWVDDGLELARTAEAEQGLWVGLWHPNLTEALGFPGALAEYRRLVTLVQERAPFVAPLNTIVAWRRARRSLVAREVSAAGAPRLAATIRGHWDVTLEDGCGNPLERLSWPDAA